MALINALPELLDSWDRRNIMRKLVGLMALVLLVIWSVPALAASLTGTVTMDIDLSEHDKDKEVKVWIPYPVSDKDQTISGIKISGDYAESAVYTDKDFSTPMLFARWNKGAASRKLNFVFDVDRQEVSRRDFPAKEAAWDSADYAPYLKGTSLSPTTGPVKVLADKITGGKTTVLTKAQAIYEWIVENMYRDPATYGCGQGDVCTLLEKPGGKCADIHSVFVALARASGIPAYEVFGLRLAKKGSEDVSTWQHCWAEFFLPGYGWVPVDPADVRKAMLTEKLELKDARTIELRNYYWGGIDPYRVKVSMGRDLTLNPPQKGKSVNYLMYPFAQIGEETIDSINPQTFKYKITFLAK
jgi:transglutaminase-like putative cysteine protease